MLEPRLTHGALRTRIHKVRAAAHDEDGARLRWEFDRLTAALAEHLVAESPTVAGLPLSTRDELRQGQDRIRAFVGEFGRELDADENRSTYESRAAYLDVLLEQQEVAERRGFRSASVKV